MAPFFLAHIVFWIALLIGASLDLGPRRIALFVSLWAIGYFASGLVSSGGLLFASYVAVLDVILVLVVFKGDVPLR